MADAGLILDLEALSKYFTERRGLFSWVACLRAEELNLSGLEQLLAAL